MNEQHIARLNAVLSEFRGGRAFFNIFRDHTSRQFTLGLIPAASGSEPAGISFFNCEFLSGPTEWNQVNLEARSATCADGTPGFEVLDSRIGFLVRGSDSITFGHTGEVLSARERVRQAVPKHPSASAPAGEA